MSRDGLPRAYLRLDPNIDHTHPDLAAFIRLLCAAARQPDRGRFRNLEHLRMLFGKTRVHQMIERRDVVELPDGRYYVPGWDEWQEGDHKVGDRMRLIRGQPKTDGARRTANWRLRNTIFERDGYTCRYCGADDYPREWLVLEHVIPDGATDEENLVTACRPCNKRKGPRTPEQAGMPLRPLLRDVSQ